MGAGKYRRIARVGGAVVVAAAVVALAAACASPAPTALALVADQPSAPPGATVTPTVTPTAVPALGKLAFGTFPATLDGAEALTLCEKWNDLRGQYVAQVSRGSRFQLEQWISSDPDWLAAFHANSPLKEDPRYLHINLAFGLASTAATASLGNARQLDAACAAAD